MHSCVVMFKFLGSGTYILGGFVQWGFVMHSLSN